MEAFDQGSGDIDRTLPGLSPPIGIWTGCLDKSGFTGNWVKRQKRVSLFFLM